MTLSYALHSYDTAMIVLTREIKRGLDRTHPVLGEIQNYRVAHGGVTRQISSPAVLDTELREHRVQIDIDISLFTHTNVGQFVMILYKMWEEFAEQAERDLFATVSDTTEAVGNTIDGREKNIWDAQLEMLDRLQMEFDEDGNHGTKMYAGPAIIERMKQTPRTEDQRLKWEEAIEKKRQEYYAQKRTRRLS